MYYCDSRHPSGGTDVNQEVAFMHIFGSLALDSFRFDLYSPLIQMHGWTCEIKKIQGTPE